jgi:argininosuccinate lyase
MKTKLWQKTSQTASENLQKVEQFTIGNDNELDMFMAAYDVLGTLAHIEMLESVGLLQKEELSVLQTELKRLFNQIQNGQFKISEGVEDIHSEVEFQLTEKLGDLGKKVHSGRSRNDQVLVDIKMYSRARLESIVTLTNQLFEILLVQKRRQIKPFYCQVIPIFK